MPCKVFVDSEWLSVSLCRNFGAFSLASSTQHSSKARRPSPFKVCKTCSSVVDLGLGAAAYIVCVEGDVQESSSSRLMALEREGKGLSWLSLSLRPRQAPALLTFQPASRPKEGLRPLLLPRFCSSIVLSPRPILACSTANLFPWYSFSIEQLCNKKSCKDWKLKRCALFQL